MHELPLTGLTLFRGDEQVTKVAVQLAWCVASNIPFAGMRPGVEGDVLYITGCNRAAEIYELSAKLARYRPVEGTVYAHSLPFLSIGPAVGVRDIDRHLAATWAFARIAEIERLMRRWKPGLVIIDTLEEVASFAGYIPELGKEIFEVLAMLACDVPLVVICEDDRLQSPLVRREYNIKRCTQQENRPQSFIFDGILLAGESRRNHWLHVERQTIEQ